MTKYLAIFLDALKEQMPTRELPFDAIALEDQLEAAMSKVEDEAEDRYINGHDDDYDAGKDAAFDELRDQINELEAKVETYKSRLQDLLDDLD